MATRALYKIGGVETTLSVDPQCFLRIVPSREGTRETTRQKTPGCGVHALACGASPQQLLVSEPRPGSHDPSQRFIIVARVPWTGSCLRSDPISSFPFLSPLLMPPPVRP